MTDISADATMHLFGTGIQYYVAGRAAAVAQLIPVSGNLLHHAVEMMLKAELSRSMPLDELKVKFQHRLLKTWGAFKAVHPEANLSEFDQLIEELDLFERIRYPDDYIRRGAMMTIGWGTIKPAVTQLKGRRMPCTPFT